MAGIILTGDTSGTITVNAPAVAGTNTISLPASTGTTVVLNGWTITESGGVLFFCNRWHKQNEVRCFRQSNMCR